MDRRQRSTATWQPIGVPGLEPAAWDALRHPGSTAVTAGPGAGKTEFLAQRATYLLQTGLCPAPQKILAISYKRESAANLAKRVAARVPEAAHRFESMTFDAFTKGLVDRFALSLPSAWLLNGRSYEVGYFNEREIRAFLEDLSRTQPPWLQSEIMAIQPSRFLPDMVGTFALPEDPRRKSNSAHDFAVLRWWWRHYGSSEAPVIDFTMLNRLAELLVRSSPQILRGLRATYPFVFVDEFQDTTAAQITFLSTIFGHPGIVATAVGDSKQRIMRFAGALEDAIGRYETDFAAKHFALTWNFRSSADLVAVQHRVATSIDPATVQTESRAKSEPDHVPLAIWLYPNPMKEAEHLAQWIADDIDSSARTSADFALIARQKVAELEPTLIAAFKKHGLSIRNDDAQCGKLKLQDLLKHDAIRFVIGLLTLAAHSAGHAGTWTDTLTLLRRVRGGEGTEEAERRLSDHLSSLIGDLSAWLSTNEVSETDAADIVEYTVSLIGTEALAGFVRGQNDGGHLELLLEAFEARINSVKDGSESWHELINNIEATDSIALMTIHRSKGLEYHTVIITGLDDQQWWSYQMDPREGNSTFFVGLSRAAHRLVFTTTRHTMPNSKIRPLLNLLEEAGAEVRECGRSSELVRLVHPVGTQFRRPGAVARFRVF
ncbi:ATP-dependent helicase [Leucobacter sp. NPDC077196]|uniref:ATP-dependent helicase n=1 Tax=Leucobacter sp. NPDC077196 TaxID=3154959 RepID=UPI00344145B9